MERSAPSQIVRVQRGFQLRVKSARNSSNARCSIRCNSHATLNSGEPADGADLSALAYSACGRLLPCDTISFRRTLHVKVRQPEPYNLCSIFANYSPRSYQLRRQFRGIERLWGMNPFYFSVGRFFPRTHHIFRGRQYRQLEHINTFSTSGCVLG